MCTTKTDRQEYLKTWRAGVGKEYQKQWYLNNKRNKVLYNRFRKFKLTHEDFLNLLAKQEYKCGICGIELSADLEDQTNTCVDHCHETNLVRGILCRLCNVLLGCAKDDTEILEKASIYLKLWTHDGTLQIQD